MGFIWIIPLIVSGDIFVVTIHLSPWKGGLTSTPGVLKKNMGCTMDAMFGMMVAHAVNGGHPSCGRNQRVGK